MSIKLVPVGRTQKTHGVNGTLRIDIEDAFLDDFIEAEVLFLEMNGQATPFFIEDRWGGDPLYLKLEEIDDKEAARPLTNKVLSLRSEDIRQRAATAPNEPANAYAKWVGYTIYDRETGEIGEIETITELPQQFLAELTFEGRGIMIPLHEDLILAIDHDLKSVLMDLPEGLLEL